MDLYTKTLNLFEKKGDLLCVTTEQNVYQYKEKKMYFNDCYDTYNLYKKGL